DCYPRGWVNGIILDVNRKTITTAGGIDDKAIKIWDMKGLPVAEYEVPGNQANGISQSKDGNYVVTSWWDRREELSREKRKERKNEKEIGTALFHSSEGGKLTPISTIDEYSWLVFFNSTGEYFFTQNSDQIALIKIKDNSKQFLPIRGGPICVSSDDKLMIVLAREVEDAALQIWHLPTIKKLFEMRLPPPPAQFWSVDRLCAAFSRNGSLLISGLDDGTIYFWNTVLFIPDETDKSTINRRAWPAWWQNAKIDVPRGMHPNPEFGQAIRVLKQKLNCKGLRLDNAKGLETVRIAGLDRDVPRVQPKPD